jgi:mannose-6-phosphate isomerase-like protein (cupin superfamily)
MREIERITLREKLALVDSYWDPKIVGELNGQHVKLVKFKGDFVWHHHDAQDEMFLVLHGSFVLELRDSSVELREGDMVIVPHGVEHRPCAHHEVHVLLFEPAGTVNTGNVTSELTRNHLDRI